MVTKLQIHPYNTVSSSYSNRIIEKINGITKKILNYFVQNQYALTVSIWSFGVIQCCLAVKEIAMTDNYVYDVDSCRRVLCNYEAKNNNPNSTEEELFNLVKTCIPSTQEILPYSFYDCLTDLCSFLQIIGEKFYACADQNLFITGNNVRRNHIQMNPQQARFWNELCPKRHLLHLTDLKLLNYFTNCMKHVCFNEDDLSLLDDEIRVLCANDTVGNFQNTIKIVSHSLVTLLEMSKKTQQDEWKISNGVSNLIIAISSILSIVAAVAVLFFTHRAITRVAIAVETLSGSSTLQQVARLANHSVRTLIQQTINLMNNALPTEAVNVVNNLNRALEEDTFSVYYSAEDSNVELTQGNPNILRGETNYIASASSGGVAGVVATNVGTANKMVDTVGSISKLAINILGSAQKNPDIYLEATTEDFMNTMEDKGEFIKTTLSEDYCIKHYISNSAKSSILHLWVDCLKESLPLWNDFYCFYNRAVNFLSCRLPTTFNKQGSFVQFYSVTIHKFFSEYKEILCHMFNEEIWCDWNKFLDLSFIKRSISFFYDEECPWDQFFLKVAEPINGVYQINARGQCYNQTAFIKV